MNSGSISAASAVLLGHVQAFSRCATLPPGLAPQTRADAYAIQTLCEKQSARPLAGWKIAATSFAGQKHIGVDGPLAGRYIAERTVASGARIPFGNNHMKVAEIEFAFRLGRDLPPRHDPFTEDEVFAAVASFHPSIEIPDSRYNRFETVGAAALIADNACAHWLCVGAAAPEMWRYCDLAGFEPVGTVAGKPAVKGKGANVLGSPGTALAWLVNELSLHGITAREGQVVSTGTCLAPMAIAAGDHITGDFGPLGRVEVTVT